MSERGNFRGRGGGGGGGGRGASDRGSGRGGRGAHSQAGGEKPKKENILDLTKYMDKEIAVKFNGGREGACDFFILGKETVLIGACLRTVTGTLKGYDQLMNLVLDDVKELLHGRLAPSSASISSAFSRGTDISFRRRRGQRIHSLSRSHRRSRYSSRPHQPT